MISVCSRFTYGFPTWLHSVSVAGSKAGSKTKQTKNVCYLVENQGSALVGNKVIYF